MVPPCLSWVKKDVSWIPARNVGDAQTIQTAAIKCTQTPVVRIPLPQKFPAKYSQFAAISYRAIHHCIIKQSQMLSLRLVFDNWVICFSSNMILFHHPCLKAFQKTILPEMHPISAETAGMDLEKNISTKFF